MTQVVEANLVKAVTAKNFTKDVLKSTIPVVVDFWATSCGPCRAMMPTLEQIAEAASGKYKIVKCNVQEEVSLGTQYDVMSVPTFLVFNKGKVVGSHIGAATKAVLERKIAALVK